MATTLQRPVAAAPAAGRRAWWPALAPAVVYLAVRLVGVLVLAWVAAVRGEGLTAALTSWDGQWFLGLASAGYDGLPLSLTDAKGVQTLDTPLAFFPGYPVLVAVVAALPGPGVTAAAFTVTTVAGVACAYGLVRLALLVPGGSRRAGLVLVGLFAAQPMGVVLSMAYSEALFCAFAVWSLVALLEGHWLRAALCCAAAGVVRPTAAALVLALVAAAIVAVVGRREWRPLLAVLVAPVGLVGWLGFVAARTGRWDGWFALQREGWDSQFDGGRSTLEFSRDVVTTLPTVLEVVTVVVLVAAVALLAVAGAAWWRTPAWPLLVYGAVVLLMDLGSNGLMNSKIRLLVPAFVLLVPPAVGLARRWTGSPALPLAGAALASAGFGAYALTIWPYAI